MTRYIANPVEVDAYKIVHVGDKDNDGYLYLGLEDGSAVRASPGMLARMIPTRGDYWVMQSDGYVYLNPGQVFERKYRQKSP